MPKGEKRNVIVGQSGGPTAAINSSLAGVYRTAIDRGYKKVYGMLHGVQGLMEGRYVDLSEHITNGLDSELLKRTPASYLGSCRYKLPEIHQEQALPPDRQTVHQGVATAFVQISEEQHYGQDCNCHSGQCLKNGHMRNLFPAGIQKDSVALSAHFPNLTQQRQRKRDKKEAKICRP